MGSRGPKGEMVSGLSINSQYVFKWLHAQGRKGEEGKQGPRGHKGMMVSTGTLRDVIRLLFCITLQGLVGGIGLPGEKGHTVCFLPCSH